MKTWKDTLLSMSAQVRHAIETIDKGQSQIALIVDEKGKLVGTVTDGDVRRGILKGVALEAPVERVMKKGPVTAHVDDSRENLLEVMKKKQVHQVPILDGEGRVVGLEILDELLHLRQRQNWVVIMAGGLGTRLAPLTESVPKPLIEVGKKPILETILENFIENGFTRFFIAVNYKDHLIKKYFGDGSKWGAQIVYLSEEKRLGTAGALGLLPEKPSEPLFVMNGDLLTKVNFVQLLDFHRQNKVSATMCVREYDFQVPYGVVKIDRHFIESINEKPVQRFFVNAGIYVLEPKVLEQIPKDEFFDMPQLFENMAKAGWKTGAFPIREYWIDIGRLNDLDRANGEFSEVFQ